MPFLEEVLAQDISFNSKYAESYAVDVVETMINRYAVLRHPFVLSRFSLLYNNKTVAQQLAKTIGLFHRVGGQAGGFRFKHQADYSSNNFIDTPTRYDQRCEFLTALTYQLTRFYGPPSATAPRRKIVKPVAGTILIGIEDAAGGNHIIKVGTYDTLTGIVTLAANRSTVVTDITNASNAVISVPGHTFTVADSVVLQNISGMNINNKRGDVLSKTAGTITVDIDSTALGAYSAGSPVGTAETNPLSTEYLTAGFEYDVPVAFEDDLSGIDWTTKLADGQFILSTGIALVEIRNP